MKLSLFVLYSLLNILFWDITLILDVTFYLMINTKLEISQIRQQVTIGLGDFLLTHLRDIKIANSILALGPGVA